MQLSPEVDAKLQEFVRNSSFASSGAVITDLDGTAVHEYQGTIVIPKEVEFGLIPRSVLNSTCFCQNRFRNWVVRAFDQIVPPRFLEWLLGDRGGSSPPSAPIGHSCGADLADVDVCHAGIRLAKGVSGCLRSTAAGKRISRENAD
jgi:hypothetical protein